MTEASIETRIALIDNMKRTGKTMYQELYRDMRLAKGIEKSVIKEGNRKSEVLKLKSNLSLMLMDICVIFPQEMATVNAVERCFLLRRCVMICHEGYKYLFGFDGKPTLACTFLEAHSKEFPEEVGGIRNARENYLQLYGTEEVRQVRNVAKHYSTDSMEFFNCVKNLSEKIVAEMIACFMAFTQPMFHLTLLVLIKEMGIAYLAAGNEQIPFHFIPNIVNQKLSKVVNENIERFGNLVLKMDNIESRVIEMLGRLGIDKNQKQMKPYLADNLAAHVFYVEMDILCAFKAFSQAIDYYEQALNLAYLRLSVHEGFKKLYGFGNNHKGTYWERLKEDFSDVIGTSSLDVEKTEREFNALSTMEYVCDKNVVIFTHFGDAKGKNIPFESIKYFEENANPLFYKDLLVVIETLNSLLPLFSSLMKLENIYQETKNDNMIDEYFGKMKYLFEKAKAKNPQLQKEIDEFLATIKKDNDMLKSLYK